tara:strand:+ start:217 stop:423 length:207 start_codon:yes stop_codon:yes gene_type:complete
MVKQKAKTKTNKICPRCGGNGYIKIPHKSVEEINQSVTVSCTMCKSQGELNDANDTFIIDADGLHRMQ